MKGIIRLIAELHLIDELEGDYKIESCGVHINGEEIYEVNYRLNKVVYGIECLSLSGDKYIKLGQKRSRLTAIEL